MPITLGQAAAVIAASIFLAKILARLLWPLILTGLTRQTDTAASWSVITRELQASYWPTILRTDAAASRGVRSSVIWGSRFAILAQVLIAITAVVTPLGLYEVVGPEANPKQTEFLYIKDTSTFGTETPVRSPLGFSRLCGNLIPIACPSSGNDVTDLSNKTVFSSNVEGDYSTKIPSNVTDFFSSGSRSLSRTVSSIFDIQWRQYSATSQKDVDHGNLYLVGDYIQLDTLLPGDDLKVVEGLVVDLQHGGIGFRNHTVPADARLGAVWSEDILFVEPVTKCADTNLTLDFTVSNTSTLRDPTNPTIVDRGGFVSLNRTNPTSEYDSADFDAQKDPWLDYRAYGTAWAFDAYTAVYLNVTNPTRAGRKSFAYLDSSLGQGHPLNKSVSTYTGTSKEIITIGGFGRLFDLYYNNASTAYLPNPWNVTSGNYSEITNWCETPFPGHRSNMTGVLAKCGLMKTAAKLKGGGSQPTIRFEPGSNYTTSLYTCASSARATIKTVFFTYNGSDLSGLVVTKIQDKSYGNPAEYPLWAVESTNKRLIDVAPLWGLVANDTDRSTPNMSFLQAPHLWLARDSTWLLGDPANKVQNLPGVDFFAQAFGVAYSDPTFIGDTGLFYSGLGNYALRKKWRELSESASTAHKVIDLIWTSVAANAVMGTKGWMSSGNAGRIKKRDENPAPHVAVTFNTQQLKYRMQYAIPGLLLLLLLTVYCVASLVMLLSRRTSIRRLRLLLNGTSIGRVLTGGHVDQEEKDDFSFKQRFRRSHSTMLRFENKRWMVQEDESRAETPRDTPSLSAANPLLAKTGPEVSQRMI